MNNNIKRGGWVAATLLGCLVLVLSAQAASFDCGKAQTKVEHLICDNPELSKLDDELSVAYKTTLKDEKQTDSIKQAQKQWMKERNGCADVSCVKRAYEERLSALMSPDEVGEWQNTFSMSEKAKGEFASKILNDSEVTLRKGPYSPDDVKFCNAFLVDFERQRDIEYVEPKFRTNDYNQPELVKLRNQCPNIKWEWMAPKKCDSKSLAYWLMKDYQDNIAATQQKAEEMCATLFGEDELAIYEIDFGEHKEHVIYQSRTPKLDSDELDRMLRKPTKKELWVDNSAWNRRTNTVMNVFFHFSGYQAFDFEKCGSNVIKGLNAANITTRDSLAGLIRYRGSYMAYSLLRVDHEGKRYDFFMGSRNPVCHFDAVQSKSTNTRSAK